MNVLATRNALHAAVGGGATRFVHFSSIVAFGFDVESRTAKLTKNRAFRNDDVGIEAVPGVIDGGGNRASGNGDLRQCINIACR